MAFPRMNAWGFWLTFCGGSLVYLSFLTGGAPALGWFAYAPLTERTFARSAATDFWALGLLVSGIGTVAGAVNFIATILGMRAPGMTLRKLPFFVWTMLWTAVQMLLAIPPLTAALVMVMFDRQLGAHFFDVQNGGSAYLWQHLFWFFGHPEVYILILPVFGMVSEIIPVFSRKVLFGYEFMAAATMAIAFISLGVWAHHMFCVGMNRTLDLFFAASSLLVSIPTGIKFFNWLATMFGGRIRFDAPMLFACGFLSLFLIGGLTGIMLAAAPYDFQLHDSYFVVGHFHWVLIGGTLFGTFAGIYYWYPKVTGRLMSERLARWQFWLLYIGLPAHIRTDARLGHVGHAAADLRLRGRPRLAILESAQHLGSTAAGAQLRDLSLQPGELALAGPARGGRSLGRLDAGVDHHLAAAALQLRNRARGPQPPAALGHQAPGRSRLDLRVTPPMPDAAPAYPQPPAIAPEPNLTAPQWGMLAFLVSEVAFFSTLIVTYALYLGQDADGPTPAEALSLPLVCGTTACLLASSFTIHAAEAALRRGQAERFRGLWTLTIALGLAFLAGTAYEWHDLIVDKQLTISRNLFGTTYYTLVGFHALHVTAGLVALALRWHWPRAGTPARSIRWPSS